MKGPRYIVRDWGPFLPEEEVNIYRMMTKADAVALCKTLNLLHAGDKGLQRYRRTKDGKLEANRFIVEGPMK